MNRVNRANRTGLLITGLVLTAAAVLGLVLSYGGFGRSQADNPILPTSWRTYVADNPWLWWVLFVLALLVALLGLAWLLAQLRTDRVSRLEMPAGGREGGTVLHAGALCDAVAADARTIAGVGGASAYLSGQPRHHLHLTADLTDRADIAEVWRALMGQTVARARQAFGGEGDLPVDLHLRLGRTRNNPRVS
ncbi:hypothetical protein [Xylanimonas sp. McL0601]|uniref:hypothetical protein n=1 Tax=Xylanimonas sp. McL0601 TaxID=3414739 RepID=UPI003CE8C69D